MSSASASDTPYLDALRAYAARDPGRFHVPGHKGGPGADPDLLAALGAAALAIDIPALTHGIDVGAEPTPFEEAQALAAEAWGAQAHVVPDERRVTGQPCGTAHARPPRARGRDQRNAHSSTIDALVLSGLRPTFIAPELDPELGIAHCMTPEALEPALAATPGAVGATVVSPTYFGAVADVAALAEVAHARGMPLLVDEAWGAHLAFHEALPAHALTLGADLVISSTHKIVGSLTQSAMLHLGHGDLLDEDVVDRCVTLIESTSPSSLLTARSTPLAARRRCTGTSCSTRPCAPWPPRARRSARCPGWTCSTSGSPARPACSTTTRSGWPSTSAAPAAAATTWPALVRERDDVSLELAGENVIVAVFGMGEDATRPAAAWSRRSARRRGRRDGDEEREHEEFAPPPPWGELVMTPREAFLGPQEVVPAREAVGRVAAESLAAYPPGIPNVLPGRAAHRRDARLHPAGARARRQPARRQRPQAPDAPRGARGARRPRRRSPAAPAPRRPRSPARGAARGCPPPRRG